MIGPQQGHSMCSLSTYAAPGGARGLRGHEETVLVARRYEGSQRIYDVAAVADIVAHELDGSRCEIRAFLTKIDVRNLSAISRSLTLCAASSCPDCLVLHCSCMTNGVHGACTFHKPICGSLISVE